MRRAWLGGASFAALAMAATAQEPPVSPDPAPPAGEELDFVDATLDVAVTSHYFFRGLLQEDQGRIVQPELELSIVLDEAGAEGAGAIDLVLGTWNSLHSGPSGVDSPDSEDPEAWYESDFYAGLAIGVGGHCTLAASYYLYTSPNGLFDDVQELVLELAHDDSRWFEGLSAFSGFAPRMTVAIELDGQSDQSDAPSGTDEGIFVGFGIEPTFALASFGEGARERAVELAFPVNVGLSFDDYYEDADGDDDHLGYWDAGAVLSIPLTSVPRGYGDWTLRLGATAVFLNGHQEDLNGDDFEWVGTAALSLAF